MRVDGPHIDLAKIEWLADLPQKFAREYPDKAALIFGETGNVISFAELDDKASRLCAELQRKGLKPGDRIGYFGQNSELFYVVMFASALGGFVLAAYNWRYAAPELAYVLKDSAPVLLIFDEEFETLVGKATADLANTPELLQTEAQTGRSLRALIESASGTPTVRNYHYDDPFLLMYTSGTTGTPKGALLSHGAVSTYRYSYDLAPQWEGWSSDAIVLGVLPNFHIAGIGIVLIGLFSGATVVHSALPTPANILDLSVRYKVNVIFMVPTIIRMVIEELEKTGGKAPQYDSLLYGASPIGPVLLQKTIDTFGCKFTQFYGMTEGASTHALGPAEHDFDRPELMKSVGKPLAGVSVEIRDKEGVVCAADVPGEIWIKSVMILLEYANNPKATAEALVEGWYRTGDGGFLNADGYLFLTDRLRDMVITGGENVYPVEVENALKAHPNVQDVAVIGTADPKWGEVVTAVLEIRAEPAPTMVEIHDFMKERLAGYKCPRALYVTEMLPRTPSGKVQRGVVKDNLANYRQIEV